MKKKYVTIDNLKKLFPSSFYAVKSDFRFNGGIYLEYENSGNMPRKEKYKLRSVEGSVIPDVYRAMPDFGFYELTELASLHNYRYLVLSNSSITEVEEPVLVDIIRPSLEKYMSGRYLIVPIQGNHTNLYLYYPELVIHNNIGEKHMLKDMVISLCVTDDGIRTELAGKRFSFTKKELLIRYSHSHLPAGSEGTNDFQNFCLGGHSALTNFLVTLNNKCSIDQFELLLAQLEQYLQWESIEGKPYILISNLHVTSLSTTSPKFNANMITRAASMFLELITEDMLFSYGAFYGVNPGVNDKAIFKAEQALTGLLLDQHIINVNSLYKYDISTDAYQEESSSATRSSLPRSVTRTDILLLEDIKRTFKITPHIYEETLVEESTSTILRIGSEDLKEIFRTVNRYLSYSAKLNGKSNSSTTSKDLHNTETPITSNPIAQPMSV